MPIENPASYVFRTFVYIGMSALCSLLLHLRRNSAEDGHTELGGRKDKKDCAGLIIFILWAIYIILSSLQGVGKIKFNLAVKV